MIDPALVARVRTAVAAGVDPATLLALYADPARRALIRERVRSVAGAAIDDAAADALCARLFGFGPLQAFLDDPAVSDVLVNGPDRIYIERDGRLSRASAAFDSAAELADLVHRIAASVGRELTIEHPFVDARMRDGSRANAVIEPIGGPSLSIRKFRPISLPLVGPAPSWRTSGGLDEDGVALLEGAVRTHRNIVVTGATGSGKSTLLRSLAALIDPDERVIVIEDTNELVLPHPHTVHLESVPSRDGGVSVADLVVNALRMRPDRLIVGEVRSPREASALLEALSTGHAGSLTTLHAGSARDALGRLELLLAGAGELGERAISRHVARAVDVVVHVERRRDGRRRIREIATITDGALRVAWEGTAA
ncbi:MAG TPA: ATPase, T2SS/T4P/T4SS family [Candidatus Saccharimonadales bacterium]|nr:ATPase, T2SS/T4P/T4SS family [Candidatus Saccharimonadales bacterium]